MRHRVLFAIKVGTVSEHFLKWSTCSSVVEHGKWGEDLFFFGTNRITICLRDVLSAHAGPFNLSGFFTLPVGGIGFRDDWIRSC